MYEGNQYLKSMTTGVVYDYADFVNCGEQTVVGKWNNITSKIDFNTNDQESEEETEDDYQDE